VYYWAYSTVKTIAQRVVAGESLSSVVSGSSASRGGKLKELGVGGNLIVGAIAGTITAGLFVVHKVLHRIGLELMRFVRSVYSPHLDREHSSDDSIQGWRECWFLQDSE
jgi:hypothetical protein